jgi:hypothetical protein
MDRHVMWAPWEGPGLEHLHLARTADAIVADGVILGQPEALPFRVLYTLTCDERWRLRTADLVAWNPERHEIHLRADGTGRWTTAQGEVLPDLAGCLEVDIGATPFTNTLPIRRLALQPGEAAEVPAAYIDVAGPTVTRVPQRYTRLAAPTGEALYLYEGLAWNFRATLRVDDDGLVMDYPGLFRRVWAK